MSASIWGEETSKRIGRQIKAVRGKRSAQQISDRTRDLGYPIGRATLSQLENGTRKAPTVPELLVIAAALDTSPAMLVFGEGLPDEIVESLPGESKSSFEALYWFAGAGIEPTDEVLRRAYLGRLADPQALAEAMADHLAKQGVTYHPELDTRRSRDGDN